MIEEMDFPRLAKLTLPNIGEAEDVIKCGSLEFYDKTYDRVNTKTERRLQRVNRVFHKVRSLDCSTHLCTRARITHAHTSHVRE